MTDRDFIERGYSEYEPTEFDSECVVKRFQKRFDDDIGKKYFIDILKWDFSKFPNIYDPYPYEYTVQLYHGNKPDADALDLYFHSSWNIDDVETFVEKIFSTGDFDYYETWDLS